MADRIKTIVQETVITGLSLRNLTVYNEGGSVQAVYTLTDADGEQYNDPVAAAVTLTRAEAAVVAALWARALDEAMKREQE